MIKDLTIDEVLKRIESGELVVAANEEFGFKYWIWFPGIKKDELIVWWQNTDVGEYYLSPSDMIFGDFVYVVRDDMMSVFNLIKTTHYAHLFDTDYSVLIFDGISYNCKKCKT